ncbi:hypothetical protein BGZ94_010325 [Podila epigama]|nr:hypothetical protein BGZ94_010325 [Podila epigama]
MTKDNQSESTKQPLRRSTRVVVSKQQQKSNVTSSTTTTAKKVTESKPVKEQMSVPAKASATKKTSSSSSSAGEKVDAAVTSKKRAAETEETKPTTTNTTTTKVADGKSTNKRGKIESGSKVKKEDEKATTSDSGAFAGSHLKITIERCTTCTQYRSNVIRLTKLTAQLYPGAAVQEEVCPSSKKFEIYLGQQNNNGKGKLIWSGHSRAPPKRLAFPSSDEFTNLLKTEVPAIKVA